jgi:mannose-6-phosphate isomerase-like protein (cupin superfamily)
MIDKKSAQHFAWGNKCDGWHLLKTDALSVIEEKIPSGGSEVRHHHQKSRQFFYVLAGILSFEIIGEEMDLMPRQGIDVAPLVPHRVFDRSVDPAEFLVISSPTSHGDRMESLHAIARSA